MFRLLLLFLLLFPAQAFAKPSFVFPSSCKLGEACWISSYIDVNPDKDIAQDYRCGGRTYDVHQGIDITLIDRVAMEAGADVLAGAAGTVVRARDALEDGQPTEEEIAKMLAEQKGCGNAVLLDHGDGWQSIYCHMKQGSIAVKEKQVVKAGEKLGLVGQSGAAEMPHVHVGVFHNGKVVDPFTGHEEGEGCGKPEGGLWAADAMPEYEPLIVYAAGFKTAAPDFEAVKIDAYSAKTIGTHPPLFTFWAGIFGLQEGDRIRMEIRDPLEGIYASNDIVQQKTLKPRQFYFIGKKTNDVPLAPGDYTGYVKITRDNPGDAPLVHEYKHVVTVK